MPRRPPSPIGSIIRPPSPPFPSSSPTAALPVLPAHQRLGGPTEDFALLPPLRGATDSEEWSFPAFPSSGAGSGSAKFSSGQSALLGDYRPPQPAAQPVASTTRCGKCGGEGESMLPSPASAAV